MRHYEIMLLIHPDQSERARVMMDRYVGIIEGGEGQVHRNEDLGRRMLAYPIAKVHKAHYMLMNVECGREILEELVGALHFSDAVLRHLVIRRDGAISEQSALAKAAEREAARESREYPYDRELAHERKSSASAPDARQESAAAKAGPDARAKDADAAAGAPGEEDAAAQEEAPAGEVASGPPETEEEGAPGPEEEAREDEEADGQADGAAAEAEPDAEGGEASEARDDSAESSPAGGRADGSDDTGEDAGKEEK